MSRIIPSLLISMCLGSCGLAGCGGSASSSPAPVPPVQPTLIATTTTLAASASSVAAGVPVLLTATVAASSGVALGTVTFSDGATTLSTAALSSGVATLTLRTFASGTNHFVTASYAGNTTYAASASTTFSLVIAPVSAPSAITAHATFSTATPHQSIAGFGGSEAFFSNYLNQHPAAADINKALFDPTSGLNLNFLRVQNSFYLFTSANASTFDTDTPKIVTAANAAHGSPVTLLMSAWTPPASIKSNGSVNGCTSVTNGNCSGGIGTLNQVNGAYNYAGFAQFWSDSLAAYATLGVKPDYISIQNEPDFAAPYVGNRFNPTEAPVTVFGTTYNFASYGLAFDTVYKKLNGSVKMVGPETFSTANASSFMTQVPPGEVSAYAHHMYNVSSGGNANGSGGYTAGGNPDGGIAADAAYAAWFAGALQFETEYYQAPGFYAAWDIHNSFANANDNAYFYWALAWPSTYVNGQAVDQAGLIYIDNPSTPTSWLAPNGWSLNDAYYAFKHFSAFVKPGFIRYDAAIDNANERASVYQSSDKKTTIIVLLNTSAIASDGVQVDLTPFTYTTSTVYRSSFTVSANAGERFGNLGPVSVAGISLPPQSVATIVLSN